MSYEKNLIEFVRARNAENGLMTVRGICVDAAMLAIVDKYEECLASERDGGFASALIRAEHHGVITGLEYAVTYFAGIDCDHPDYDRRLDEVNAIPGQRRTGSFVRRTGSERDRAV